MSDTTSYFFKLHVYSAKSESSTEREEGTKQYSAVYTRDKDGKKDNDPKVGNTISKGDIFEYNDTGSESYELYWIVKSVSNEQKNKDDDSKVDIGYEYVRLKTGIKTVTYSEGITATPDSTTHKLKRLTFERQLYKPNQIVADVSFTTSPDDDTLDALSGKRVVLERYSKDTSTNVDTLEETFTGFYIHDILTLDESGSDFHVRFHIYSLDHQLTLRRYSRTYVAKKLFQDIVLEGVTDSSDDYSTVFPQYNTQPVQIVCPFHTYFKKTANKTEGGTTTVKNTLTDFDSLSYKTSVTNDNKTTETHYERIQPYLVQYNESFYDFVARVANRCGEFMFFDDGCFRIGRTCDDSASRTDVVLDTSIKNDDCLSVYVTGGSGGTSFKEKYMTLDDLNPSSSKVPQLNHTNEHESIGDISKNKDFYCNAELNHDVYNTRVYKDRFESYENCKTAYATRYALGLVSQALNQQSVYDMVKQIGTSEVLSWSAAAAWADGTNNLENARNFDKDSAANKTERLDDKSTPNSIRPFASIKDDGLINATFYDDIRSGQESQEQTMATFNMDCSKKFRLGQAISYNNKSYIITSIRLQGTGNDSKFTAMDAESEKDFENSEGWTMQVKAILAGTNGAYPPRVVPPVRHSAPQIAFVAEFHDPQRRGRVRLTYPWQNKADQEPSPWVRVLTPAATLGGGCAFELGIGDEVLVDYESGNVERPYVAGTLFNRDNAIPYLRGDMALISKNGHGITFDDPIDSTKFLAGVSPAYDFVHQFLHPFQSGSPAALNLTGGITLSDAYGFYKIQMSTDQRRIDIASPFGSVNINAFTGITISAPNGDINIKGQNVNIEAGNAVKITSGLNIKNKGALGFLLGDDTSVAEAVFSGLGNALYTGITDCLKTVTELVDLDLLRKIIQVFLRPIDGTMEIKSYQYMLLSAGDGEATVQPDRYKRIRDDSFGNIPTYSDNTRKHRSMTGYVGAAEKISTVIETVLGDIDTKWTEFDQSKTAYTNALTPRAISFFDSFITADEIINEVDPTAANAKTYVATDRGTDGDFQKSATFNPQNQNHINFVDGVITAANNLAKKTYDYYKSVDQVRTGIETEANNNTNVTSSNAKSLHYEDMKKVMPSVVTEFANNFNRTNFNGFPYNNFNSMDDLKKHLKRYWFHEMFKDDSDFESSAQYAADNNGWAAYVQGLQPKTASMAKRAGKSALESLATVLTQYTDFVNEFRDRDHWKADKKGQIILSDKEGESFYFDNNYASQKYTNGTNEKDTKLTNLTTLLNNW